MNNIFRISGIILIVILYFSCKKAQPGRPAVITTTNVTDVLYETATSGGNIISDGGAFVGSRGICYGTSSGPTTDDNITIDGSGTGKFTSLLTGLLLGTKYYLRAYAINSLGTVYGEEVTFTTHITGVNYNSSLSYGTVTDIGGKSYKTIPIGSQIWMADNLGTVKFNDGTSIPLETGGTNWSNLVSPAYCWAANNDTLYGNFYGALYNWYSVNTGQLCPEGWHIPTDTEWQVLVNYLGGSSVAGSKIKEAGTNNWTTSDRDATNESGFTALPSGSRESYYGFFEGQGTEGGWWSATELDPSPLGAAWTRWISADTLVISRNSLFKKAGLSVRCLKD